MAAGSIVEIGTHDNLIKRPEGAYARLCNAQRIREATEEARGVDDNVPIIIDEDTKQIIPPEDLDPLGRLKRQATGRSAVSSLLSHRRHEVTKKEKQHGFVYLFWRIGKLNSDEWA